MAGGGGIGREVCGDRGLRTGEGGEKREAK